MEKGAYIGHLNVAIHLDYLELGQKFYYREKQLDYRFSLKNKSMHFAHDKSRKSELIIGKESAITKSTT